MRMSIAVAILLAGLTFAAAQSVSVSDPVKDAGGIVTVKISYESTDPDFKPLECHFYSLRYNVLSHIHSGCAGAFTREFNEGQHMIVLVANGKSGKLEGNAQRSDVAIIVIQPRIKLDHHRFEPNELKLLEQKK